MIKEVDISNFADRMNGFVDQKRALGYQYKDSFNHLTRLANFIVARFPFATTLSKELVLAYCTRNDNESWQSVLSRSIVTREFAKYLCSLGEEAYILPKGFVKVRPHKTPHIFTIEEIKSIWNVADSLPSKGKTLVHLLYPVLLRMIYCCGLRPIEGLKLTVVDVDLQKGTLLIRESKGHKSRLIAMPDDLLTCCIKYNRHICRLMPNRKAFFPNTKGTQYCYQEIWKIFKQILVKAGVTNGRAGRPRVYDFRHSFATHRLYLWMKEGKNLHVMLPYLSAYMGHANIASTLYYIHLVPGIFENMSGKTFSQYQYLLPEVLPHE